MSFHPDFILWVLVGHPENRLQYVTFIEPHGLLHEGPASEKIQFHKRSKDLEHRLSDPSVILNSFILSWTRYPQLKWSNTQDELEEMHVLFMTHDRDRYINKLFSRLKKSMKQALTWRHRLRVYQKLVKSDLTDAGVPLHNAHGLPLQSRWCSLPPSCRRM